MNTDGTIDISEITKETYNKHFRTYVEQTISVANGEFKDWMDHYLSFIPNNGRILEIGSASGRDARYFASKGYSILCTDIVREALNNLAEEGFETEEYDFRNPPNPEWINAFDGYFANAVLLHAQPEDFLKALQNIALILKKQGIAAISLKNGSGELITSEKMNAPRYFRLHNEDELREIFQKLPLEIIDLRYLEERKWIYIFVKKRND